MFSTYAVHMNCWAVKLARRIRRPHAGGADSSNRGPFTQLGPVGTIFCSQTCEDKASAIMWALVKVFWLQHYHVGILATTSFCQISFFRIVNCLGVEGWICHSRHYQKCKEQELDLADSLCEGGWQLESVEVSQGFPIHDALFFLNELSLLFKSHMMRSFDWPMGARHNKRKMANERRAQ